MELDGNNGQIAKRFEEDRYSGDLSYQERLKGGYYSTVVKGNGCLIDSDRQP